MRWVHAASGAVLVAAFAAGYLVSRVAQPVFAGASAPPPSFHDIRVNPVEGYVGLIEPEAPAVVALAASFGSLEEAYQFVSKQIRFAPFVPPGPVEETLRHGVGSCLGKAVLLCSLYRAMGLSPQEVRVFTGLVYTPQGPVDHVWVDLEYQDQCVQQDPSGMLGRFEFYEFPGNRYTDSHVMKEIFCFNDAGFAVVSQLNRYRDGGAAPH
ncbi:MAG TPA: transglutaminase domain-containing protein [Deferrisomatales bacterium]|nr:transglutaminase domain-containing protein [Deferrisomatales bacterium]